MEINEVNAIYEMPQKNTHVEKRCYTVQDLQTIMGISRVSVYALLKKNEFRWFQIGNGRYRIPKKGFDEWLESGN